MLLHVHLCSNAFAQHISASGLVVGRMAFWSEEWLCCNTVLLYFCKKTHTFDNIWVSHGYGFVWYVSSKTAKYAHSLRVYTGHSVQLWPMAYGHTKKKRENHTPCARKNPKPSTLIHPWTLDLGTRLQLLPARVHSRPRSPLAVQATSAWPGGATSGARLERGSCSHATAGENDHDDGRCGRAEVLAPHLGERRPYTGEEGGLTKRRRSFVCDL